MSSSPALDVVLVKIGGSSITHKSTKEALNDGMLKWFSSTLSSCLDPRFTSINDIRNKDDESPNNRAFVVIHGAGSFGHHIAKEYGLKSAKKASDRSGISTQDLLQNDHDAAKETRLLHGLCRTRLSVQTLNRLVVQSLIDHSINAVGISPCFAVPGLHAHGGGSCPLADEGVKKALQSLVHSTLKAGLVPVLHGDAGLNQRAGEPTGYRSPVGVLSGDALMELIGDADWVSEAVFLTDVAGVFTCDPKKEPEKAQLIQKIPVVPCSDPKQSSRYHIRLDTNVIQATGSQHEHDVTGGLQVYDAVRNCTA